MSCWSTSGNADRADHAEGNQDQRQEYEFDIIIYATGFDAITGSFDKIDLRGADGARLKDKWKSGPETYLGIMVDGFPNMLMLMGPHTALGNIPRSIEYSVDWVTGLLRYATEAGLTRVAATPSGVTSWTDHVKALGVGLLSNEVNSWMTGINRNVEGKQTRIVARYSGSAPAYRARCDEVAAMHYQELALGAAAPLRPAASLRVKNARISSRAAIVGWPASSIRCAVTTLCGVVTWRSKNGGKIGVRGAVGKHPSDEAIAERLRIGRETLGHAELVAFEAVGQHGQVVAFQPRAHRLEFVGRDVDAGGIVQRQ